MMCCGRDICRLWCDVRGCRGCKDCRGGRRAGGLVPPVSLQSSLQSPSASFPLCLLRSFQGWQPSTIFPPPSVPPLPNLLSLSSFLPSFLPVFPSPFSIKHSTWSLVNHPQFFPQDTFFGTSNAQDDARACSKESSSSSSSSVPAPAPAPASLTLLPALPAQQLYELRVLTSKLLVAELYHSTK